MTLREALRVARRAIIVEDIYYSSWGKHLVHFLDSLFNLEFSGHPHNNKDDTEWKELFHNQGVTLVDATYHKVGGLVTQVTYCLER